MASNSFRDSINSLGWSRREQEAPISTNQQTGLLSSLKSLNPFGDRGYVQLPTTEGAGAPLPAPTRREEEEGFLACESALFLVPGLPLQPFPPCRPCAGPSAVALSWVVAHEHGLLVISHLSFPSCLEADRQRPVSRWDRMLIFAACNLAALVCFVLCFALFPILWPVPRKFVIL